MATRLLHRSWASGEMSPEMFGHVDDRQFHSAARRLRNFIVMPQGPAKRRPGFQHVAEAGDSTKRVRLFKFAFSAEQNIAVEAGEGYFRFHADGEPLTYTTPDAYIAPSVISAVGTGGFTNGVDLANDIIDFTAAHNLTTGDPIYFYQSGGAVPTGLTEGVRYYAVVTTSTRIKVATTEANAMAGTPVVDLTGAGSGTRTCAFVYDPMDLALYLSVGHYCHTSTLGVAPAPVPSDTAYWYAMPTSPNIYEIPHSYTEDELFDISYDQSFDVLSLAHQAHPLAELRRYGTTRWQLTDVSFSPISGTPSDFACDRTYGRGNDIKSVVTGPTFSDLTTEFTHQLALGDTVSVLQGSTYAGVDYIPLGNYVVDFVSGSTVRLRTIINGDAVLGAGAYTQDSLALRLSSASSDLTNEYKVTSVDQHGHESDPTDALSVDNNLFADGAKNVLRWTAVTNARRYKVYKLQSGLFGYIGQVDDDTKDGSNLLHFTDDNIAPDLGLAPPLRDTSLSGTDYPGCVGHFQQRRVMAGTPLAPQDCWMTASGTESDMSFSLPTVDSDRIQFRISSLELSEIRHIIPLSHLVLMTNSCEYRVTPLNTDAVTPSSIAVRPQSYVGASRVKPLVCNGTVVFCAARGGHVRELGANQNNDNFATGDLSLRAAHLFDGKTIVDAAYAKAPVPIAWHVSSDGLLLGFTYVPEEGIGGWHWHDTDGLFESVVALTEGDEDRLYAVVKRGSTRYIQRMAPILFGSNLADGCFVDSSVTYDGVATTTITGLDHLDGEDVSILADGAVLTGTVASGSVTLATAASTVHVGLPYTSELHTMPLVMQVDGFGQGRTKNINKAWVRVSSSSTFQLGPADDDLVDAFTADTDLHDEEVQVTVNPSWGQDTMLRIVQSDPTPLTVVGLTLEVAAGG